MKMVKLAIFMKSLHWVVFKLLSFTNQHHDCCLMHKLHCYDLLNIYSQSLITYFLPKFFSEMKTSCYCYKWKLIKLAIKYK